MRRYTDSSPDDGARLSRECRARDDAIGTRAWLACLVFLLCIAGASAIAQTESASDDLLVVPGDSAPRLHRGAPFAEAARVSAALERRTSEVSLPANRRATWMPEPPDVHNKRRPFVIAGALAGGMAAAVMLVRDSHDGLLGPAGGVLLMPLLVPPCALAGGLAGYGISLIFIPPRAR